jgi:hypothetical protein
MWKARKRVFMPPKMNCCSWREPLPPYIREGTLPVPYVRSEINALFEDGKVLLSRIGSCGGRSVQDKFVASVVEKIKTNC